MPAVTSYVIAADAFVKLSFLPETFAIRHPPTKGRVGLFYYTSVFPRKPPSRLLLENVEAAESLTTSFVILQPWSFSPKTQIPQLQDHLSAAHAHRVGAPWRQRKLHFTAKWRHLA